MKEFDRFSFPRNYSGKVPLFFRKFPEKFRRKFPEISELTTLLPFKIIVHIDCLIIRRVAKIQISHTAAVWLGTPYLKRYTPCALG